MSAQYDELAGLYARGVREASGGEELQARDVLDVLSVFGEDGVRAYMLGVLEGLEEFEEWEDELTKVAYVVHESDASILDESENRLEVWVEECNPDLRADGDTDLYLVNDEEVVVKGGEIVRIEFADTYADDPGRPKPAKVYVEKGRFESVEYEESWNPFDD